MPNYTYHCDGCHHEFVKRQKISERHVPCEEPCPECKQVKVTQRITAVNFSENPGVRDKRPDAWKEVLKKADKYAGKHSTVDL